MQTPETNATTERTDDINEPVDVALEIALEAADDSLVREHIRRALQEREIVDAQEVAADV